MTGELRDWETLGTLEARSVTTVQGYRGVVYAFAIEQSSRKLFVARQSESDSTKWSEWTSANATDVVLATAVLTADDRVRVFYRGLHNIVRSVLERGPGSLSFVSSGDHGLSGPIDMKAATLSDRREVVFCVTSQNDLNVLGTNGFSSQSWEDLGMRVKQSGIGVAHDEEGRLNVFAVGLDGTLQHAREIAGGWSKWVNRGGRLRKITAIDHRGDIRVFAIGDDYAMWSIANERPGFGWGEWRCHGSRLRDIDATTDGDGNPVVVATDFENEAWLFTPGRPSASMVTVTQGTTVRIAVVGIDLAGATDIEIEPPGRRLVSVLDSVTMIEETPKILRFDLLPEYTGTMQVGRHEYRLRLTDALHRPSNSIMGTLWVQPHDLTPRVDSVVLESAEHPPNEWKQGDRVLLRLDGMLLRDAKDVLLDDRSMLEGEDAEIVGHEDDRELVVALSPNWTRARAPGPLRGRLIVVGTGGQHGTVVHLAATVLASDDTPRIDSMELRSLDTSPEEEGTTSEGVAQGSELVVVVQGRGLGAPRELRVDCGGSRLTSGAIELHTDRSGDQALVFSIDAAHARTLVPGPQILALQVVGAQGNVSDSASLDIVVGSVDSTPRLDAVWATQDPEGSRNAWEQGGRVRLVFEGSDLQEALDVLDGERNSLLDDATVILRERSDANTLEVELAPEATCRHAPGTMELLLTVVNGHGYRSNAIRFRGHVRPSASAPRLRSIIEDAS